MKLQAHPAYRPDAAADLAARANWFMALWRHASKVGDIHSMNRFMNRHKRCLNLIDRLRQARSARARD